MRRTMPISQVEIEQELMRLANMLEDETEDFEILAEDAAKKEARFKKEWAKEFLTAKGAVKERESWADYKCGDACEAHKIADALMRAKREKLNSLRTSIDALRTMAANVRAMVA